MWSSSVISRTPRRTRLSCTVADRPLVAGDHAAGEHHRVALAQRDARMRVHRDARQRAARLALAAGDQDQQIVVRDIVGLVLADEARNGRQIAAFARRRLQVAQAAADQRHAAPGILRRQRDRSPPAPRCWRSRSRPRARAGRGSAPAGAPHIGLRAGMALDHRVGRSRRPSPARPRRPARANAASSVGGPTSGSGSSFQSPVCSTMPCRRA